MSKSIFIENGRIVDPSQNLDAVANLLVINGKVAGINVDPAGVDPEMPRYDAKGLLVLPGLVDMHVHLR